MAIIVNLNGARKAKRRAAAAMQANVNRAAFGRTKAERDEAAAQTASRNRILDGAKRER